MLTFDLSDFEQRARDLGKAVDQVPFALANAMTTAAYTTKTILAEDVWPQHVKVRNTAFMQRALKVKKAQVRDFRAGGALAIEIYDDLGRANLKLHARAGVRCPTKGGNLAIPDASNVEAKMGSRGVPQRLKPRNLANSFRKGNAIFQRIGPKGRHLKLMYVLRRSANIKATVPFDEEFQRLMRQEVVKAFPTAIANAVKTAGKSGRYDRQLALGRRAWSDHGNSMKMRPR